MIRSLSILCLFFFMACCNAQTDNKGSSINQDVETTPPIYFGIPVLLSYQDTSAGWDQEGQHILLTGTVYQIDGKTPAPDVIIYYYQTDINGEYVHKDEIEKSHPYNSMGLSHGYIRGWVKTNENGKYEIYTVRPGTYPSRAEPAHIHLNVKEPDLPEHYYIDDFVFDDDRLLTTERRKRMENRGGSGVLRLVQADDLLIGERDIILGLNIPDYPKKVKSETLSGKNIGENIISFTPFHAWGPDKGTKTCPICKYGWYQGILYFVGNNPDWDNIRKWMTFLEEESIRREKYLKVYFIYGNENHYSKSSRISELEKLGNELELEKVALTFVPSFSDVKSDIHLNNINPEVENTLMIYKRSNVIDKYVNLKPSAENFKLISQSLDASINEYFDLPRPGKK